MKVEVLQSGKRTYFRLIEPVTIAGFIIPTGFDTDFASVPRSFWNILPPIGKHNRAALLHDYMYVNNIGTRKFADNVFFNVMIQDGVNIIQAYVMYLGVRIGGRKWWLYKGSKRLFKQ
jgi:hypothetical protein